jgi:hypothetical protein
MTISHMYHVQLLAIVTSLKVSLRGRFGCYSSQDYQERGYEYCSQQYNRQLSLMMPDANKDTEAGNKACDLRALVPQLEPYYYVADVEM